MSGKDVEIWLKKKSEMITERCHEMADTPEKYLLENEWDSFGQTAFPSFIVWLITNYKHVSMSAFMHLFLSTNWTYTACYDSFAITHGWISVLPLPLSIYVTLIALVSSS